MSNNTTEIVKNLKSENSSLEVTFRGNSTEREPAELIFEDKKGNQKIVEGEVINECKGIYEVTLYPREEMDIVISILEVIKINETINSDDFSLDQDTQIIEERGKSVEPNIDTLDGDYSEYDLIDYEGMGMGDITYEFNGAVELKVLINGETLLKISEEELTSNFFEKLMKELKPEDY